MVPGTIVYGQIEVDALDPADDLGPQPDGQRHSLDRPLRAFGRQRRWDFERSEDVELLDSTAVAAARHGHRHQLDRSRNRVEVVGVAAIALVLHATHAFEAPASDGDRQCAIIRRGDGHAARGNHAILVLLVGRSVAHGQPIAAPAKCRNVLGHPFDGPWELLGDNPDPFGGVVGPDVGRIPVDGDSSAEQTREESGDARPDDRA